MSTTAQARESALSWLALFTSVGTLLCCALPALLIMLGAGAAVAGFVAAVPQIVLLSEHKGVVFAVSGLMLVAAAVLRYVNRNAPCPADPVQARACARLRRVGGVPLGVATAMYAVGFFFAFVAAQILA